jgi:hypothetical protein
VIAKKLRKMAAFYHLALVDKGGTGPRKMDENTYVTDAVMQDGQAHDHLVWCCEQVMKFADLGQTEIGEQWLGFVQGALWALGYFTIEEMRQHSMNLMLGMSED